MKVSKFKEMTHIEEWKALLADRLESKLPFERIAIMCSPFFVPPGGAVTNGESGPKSAASVLLIFDIGLRNV